MTAGFANVDVVGVETKKRSRNNTAPNTVSAAVAAFLGATAPAAAASPKPIRILSSEVRPAEAQTEWRANATKEQLVPTVIDDDTATGAVATSTALALADAVAFASAARRALPINEEMDDRISRALDKRPDGYTPRKLSRK